MPVCIDRLERCRMQMQELAQGIQAHIDNSEFEGWLMTNEGYGYDRFRDVLAKGRKHIGHRVHLANVEPLFVQKVTIW